VKIKTERFERGTFSFMREVWCDVESCNRRARHFYGEDKYGKKIAKCDKHVKRI